MSERFTAYRVEEGEQGPRGQLRELTLDDLAGHPVLVRVHYSSVNYKDALAGSGQGRILRRFPLIGGIDLAGEVLESEAPDFKPGAHVLITGSGLSETLDGGYSPYQRVPADNLIPLPEGLSLQEAMIIGTAGFTAALSLYRMEQNGLEPGKGSVLVTGATGGVGMLAVDLLSQAGYSVSALTGKLDRFDFLQQLGASQCLARQDIDWGYKMLETASWQGAIDNCGGPVLAGLLKHIQPWGSVASCGLTASHELHTTVMPFIIRGVNLLGINSSGTPVALRRQLWNKLAGPWKPAHLDKIHTRTVTLEELDAVFDDMLAGNSFGRTLVDLT